MKAYQVNVNYKYSLDPEDELNTSSHCGCLTLDKEEAIINYNLEIKSSENYYKNVELYEFEVNENKYNLNNVDSLYEAYIDGLNNGYRKLIAQYIF